MKRRDLIKSLTFAALGTGALLTSGNSDAAPPVADDGTPVLSVGESTRYDEGLKITFISVPNDSRCPMNAKCISAGDAEVILRVRVGKKPAKLVSLHTNDKPRSVVLPANDFPPGTMGIPKSYTLKIGSLTPQPTAGKKTRQADYRLKLAITVAY